MFSRLIFTVSFIVRAGSSVQARLLSRVKPESAGMNPAHLSLADSTLNHAISAGEIPGAVLAVVRHGKMAYLKAYGNRQNYPSAEEMTTNTIFDLASCSKSSSTAICAMQLIERGQMRLLDPVSRYLPGFQPWKDPKTGETTEIRIQHLLTHSSGLPAYASVEPLTKQHGSPCPDALLAHINNVRRQFAPATGFRYSCLNFITLQYVIERITGQSLADYAHTNVFKPLGMLHTAYCPPAEWKPIIAPTERQADGSVLRGVVHDPLARVINGGISGNAGLFSSAEDLAVLCAALQNGGEWNGARILSPASVKAMRTVPENVKEFGRTLGWDCYSAYSSNKGDLFSEQAYGHTGFTGTSIVIDPVTDTSVILLINAVHPNEGKSVIRLRSIIANIVAASITK